MDLKQHLIELTQTPGLSGYEAPIRNKLHDAWSGLVDEIATDAMGNLIATRYGTGDEPRHKILVTAHMDEIGLIVTGLDGTFIRVSNVGGIDRRILLGQPVIVHGQEDLPGLIGCRPPHVLPAEDRKKYPELEDLVIDTGLTPARLKKLVQIGAPVSFDQKAVEMSGDLVSGKAMDNRASCAMLTDLLHELQTRRHRWDVIVAAAVQEEVGRKGAGPLTWATTPDLAIVVDVTWGTGLGVGEDKGFPLGKGPTLIIGPNAHPKLFHQVKETAEALEIDIAPEPAERDSGTDGYAVQISRSGVPVAILSIPIRNMHTPVEIVNIKDIHRVTRIITEFITHLNDDTLPALAL